MAFGMMMAARSSHLALPQGFCRSGMTLTKAAMYPRGPTVPDKFRSARVISPGIERSLVSRARFASVVNSAAVADALEEDKMFCYQCEQTKHGSGCTTVGVCGKTPEVSALQDLLLYRLKGLAGVAVHARSVAGISDPDADEFFNLAIFSTLTNVNFDDERFVKYIKQTNRYIAGLKQKLEAAGAAPVPVPQVPWFDKIPHPFAWDMQPDSEDLNTFIDLGHQIGISSRRSLMKNDTLLGLHELLTYGLKGAAAYAHHAATLGQPSQELNVAFQEYLSFICKPEAADPGAVLGQALALGGTNLAVMKTLEEAHTSRFGHPTPTEVNTSPVPGKSILITGHDLGDLQALLEQTQGTGINVYTHGELLPAHGYPELRKYPHLKGHFGGAWYRQKIEFESWPGAILVTTNCVLEPPEGATYGPNMFTTGETGVPGVRHVGPKEFGPVVERAMQLPGFGPEQQDKADGPKHLVGFGRETMLGAAPEVLDAIKAGKLEHIFLVGGCDGSEGSRRYYNKVSGMMPKSSAILTLGCAKYRLLGQDFGTVPGTNLPRLLDMGQCNDAYGAIQVAVALAEALETKDGVNGLPLSLDISWFEQKAVAVLLSLLHLGVKDIRLGPALPAFLTPDAIQILVDTFELKPASLKNPEDDLAAMLLHGH